MRVQTLKEKLNKELPPAIRVFFIQRVAASFHARHGCSGRRYEYLIPAYVLRPPSASSAQLKLPLPGHRERKTAAAAAAKAGTADATASGGAGAGAGAGAGTEASTLPPSTDGDGDITMAAATPAAVDSTPDAYQTGAAFQTGRVEAWASARGAHPSALPSTVHIAAPTARDESNAASAATPAALEGGVPDKFQTGAAQQAGREEEWADRRAFDSLKRCR